MKHKRNLLYLLASAFLLSLLAFVIDLNDYYPSIKQNIIDILMMTAIFFCVQLFIYGVAVLANKGNSKADHS